MHHGHVQVEIDSFAQLYLVENFRHSFDMDSYIYFTQVMQAETLASAYRLWRRNWRGPGKEYTSGALVWQVKQSHTVISVLQSHNRS